jgi:nucleoside-diphosphate-sugar epimerase
MRNRGVLAKDWFEVTVRGSPARFGSERDLEWLGRAAGPGVRVVEADARDLDAVDAAAEAHAILHLAAQVAVT